MDLPSYKMGGSFHSYVNVYQRVDHIDRHGLYRYTVLKDHYFADCFGASGPGVLYVNYIMGLVMGGVVPFTQHTLVGS